MKTCFIFNPCSGKNRRDPWLATAIPAFIARHRLDATLVFTEAPGHATALARFAIAEGCERIVAVGGDGTLNEVAQAVAGTPAVFALVPCGSGNGLALHLGIPVDPLRALELLVDGRSHVRTIDTGEADGRPFFNAMGVGFDAEISRRFNQLTRRGLPAYFRTGIAAFRDHKPEQVTIISGAQRVEMETFLLAVTNSDQYGNNARIAPGARVDDGRLDLIAVRPTGFMGAASLAVRLFSGGFDLSKNVVRLGGERFVIQRNAPGLFHTDGETHDGPARLEVVVRPANLRVSVPAPVAGGKHRSSGPVAHENPHRKMETV
jgi:YegS/Rv2252/BmrU family lipid kinase